MSESENSGGTITTAIMSAAGRQLVMSGSCGRAEQLGSLLCKMFDALVRLLNLRGVE